MFWHTSKSSFITGITCKLFSRKKTWTLGYQYCSIVNFCEIKFCPKTWAYFTFKLGWLEINVGTKIGPQNNIPIHPWKPDLTLAFSEWTCYSPKHLGGRCILYLLTEGTYSLLSRAVIVVLFLCFDTLLRAAFALRFLSWSCLECMRQPFAL